MTALWTQQTVAAATGGAIVGEGQAATGVTIDTRALAPGDVFIALVGDTGRDGHDYAVAADASGAAFVLADRDLPVPHVRVRDTGAALTALGRAGRQRSGARRVAITGSVGKTTTKEMLRTLLAAAGSTHAAVASHNNHWGVPLTLARLPPQADYAVLEIGMNHAGEIAPLARLAAPHVALITAIETVHIGHLGSLEAIAREKATLLDGLTPGGIAILPADSPYLPLLRQQARINAVRVLTFGTAADADLRLSAVKTTAAGTDAILTPEADDGRSFALRLAAPGAHMAHNAAAALLAVSALGLDAAALAPALSSFSAVAGRGARRLLQTADGGTALLIDDSYNASAASVRAALAVLALQPARRRIAVLGDMLELGPHAAAEHRGLAPDAARDADAVFTCGPGMAQLAAALPPGLHAGHAADSAALAPLIANAVRDGDAVLVKGSLSSGMRAVVEALG